MSSQKRVFDNKLSTVFFISIVYPLGPAAIILMPMLVGGVIEGYGFSEQQAGYIAALEGMGLVVSSLLAATWVRRLSWTTALLVGFLLNAVLNVISANLSDFTPLLILRFLAGVSAGSIFAVTVAALGDNSHPDRAFGIAQVLQGAMMFVAFAGAPYILELWTVSGLYYMLAAVSLLMVLTLFRYPSSGAERLLEEGSDGSESNSYTGYIWLGLVASFLYFSNIFGFWTYVERIGDAAGLSSETIGLALGLSQFAAIVGAGAAAIASHRYGRTAPLLIAMLGQMLVLWLLLGQFSSLSFYIGVGLFQALFVMANSYQLGVIAKIDIKGHFLVLVTGFQGLGAAVGPAVAASLINEGDYSQLNVMAGLLCIVSISIFFFIIYRTRHIESKLVDNLAGSMA